MEPSLRQRAIARRRREMDWRSGVAENLLEFFSAKFERRLPQILVAEREKIPRDKRSRRLLSEHLHARCGGMDAQEQRFEIESVASDNDDLAVDDAALRKRGQERRGQLRKISIHPLLLTAPPPEFVALSEH